MNDPFQFEGLNQKAVEFKHWPPPFIAVRVPRVGPPPWEDLWMFTSTGWKRVGPINARGFIYVEMIAQPTWVPFDVLRKEFQMNIDYRRHRVTFGPSPVGKIGRRRRRN